MFRAQDPHFSLTRFHEEPLSIPSKETCSRYSDAAAPDSPACTARKERDGHV